MVVRLAATRSSAVAATACALVALAAAAPQRVPVARDVTYDEAEPVLAAAGPAAPPDVVQRPPDERASAWRPWIASGRAVVAARVLRGEEDSLVPLLLFGTSFTRAPRITRGYLEDAAQRAPIDGAESALRIAFGPRVDDLLKALERPGHDERLLWARATLERRGLHLDTPAGRAQAGVYLVENFARVTRESGGLSARLRAADDDRDRSERARVFAGRGLAPDTAWPIGFAVRAALVALAASGSIAAPVRRVAIVGPGLDFVDKDEGHDYAPPQCLQPFAVMDALVDLGLARAGELDVTGLDVSARVLGHLGRLRSRTAPYDLQLSRVPDVPWRPDAAEYFRTFGARIGRPTVALRPPAAAGRLETRAVRVSRAALSRVAPLAFDVVHQRLDLAAADRFDLVIATNVLLYYDSFEQALAARSLAALLSDRGVLLTNTDIDGVPAFPMRRVSRTTHVFSARPGDGEVMSAYRR